MALTQAHGSPGYRRGAAPRWRSTRTPVTARHHRTVSEGGPRTLIDKIESQWLAERRASALHTSRLPAGCARLARPRRPGPFDLLVVDLLSVGELGLEP